MIYITEYDALGNGQMLTKDRHCVEEKGSWNPVCDGEEIYFLNATVEENNDISELLQLFLKKELFQSDKFKKLADKVNYYKSTTKGVGQMCEVIEEYANKKKLESTMDIAKRMLQDNLDVLLVAKYVGLDVEEVEKLYDEICAVKKIES